MQWARLAPRACCRYRTLVCGPRANRIGRLKKPADHGRASNGPSPRQRVTVDRSCANPVRAMLISHRRPRSDPMIPKFSARALERPLRSPRQATSNERFAGISEAEALRSDRHGMRVRGFPSSCLHYVFPCVPPHAPEDWGAGPGFGAVLRKPVSAAELTETLGALLWPERQFAAADPEPPAAAMPESSPLRTRPAYPSGGTRSWPR